MIVLLWNCRPFSFGYKVREKGGNFKTNIHLSSSSRSYIVFALIHTIIKPPDVFANDIYWGKILMYRVDEKYASVPVNYQNKNFLETPFMNSDVTLQFTY